MAIGNIPNLQQLNSQAAQIAGTFTSNAAAALKLQAYVTSLGTTGLVALGFTAADAAAFVTCCNYLATIAQVIEGTATQATLFNFQNALVALTGPN